MVSERLENYFRDVKQLFIQQIKEWAEVVIDFETRNKYEVLDETGFKKGFIAEQSGGFLGFIFRMFLRNHRPMEVHFFNDKREIFLKIKRPFYFFWSDMHVMNERGIVIGHVYRKFGFIILKKYELTDYSGKVFAKISSPLWRLWTFPVLDKSDREIARISKNWGGLLKEYFTDADKFHIKFSPNFTTGQKAVLYATAISIDMDYFEGNSKSVLGRD